MCAVSSRDGDSDFDEFKGDIEAAERRVAREIDPGARALVVAILVFVLLLSFVLPHTGGARGFDVLVGDDAAIRGRDRAAVAGVQLAGAGVRRRVLDAGAADPALGAGVDRARRIGGGLRRSGMLAVWSRQTVAEPHPGPGIGLIVAWIAVILLTFHWARVVWCAHRGAAGRRGGAPPARPPSARARACWRASTTRRATTTRPERGLALLAERPCAPLRPTHATAAALARACSASLVRPAASAFSACRSNCSARERNWSALACGLRIAPPWSAASRTFFSTARSRRSSSAAALARHLADRVPLVADRPQRGAGGVRGRRCRSSRPRPAAPPWRRRWRLNSASRSAVTALRAEKNVSCAALNRCHSASSTSLAARPAAFHSVSRSRNAAAGRAPVGGVGQLLGAFAQRLLGLRGRRRARGRARRNASRGGG